MDSRIRQAIIGYIEVNLNRKLTENELARQSALTAQHFCVLFKANTGESPMRYLNRLRMQKARELLECRDRRRLSIKEVAAFVGCHDVSHFVRDFEKRFGLSPKRYRESK